MTTKPFAFVLAILICFCMSSQMMAQYDHINSTLFQQQYTNAGASQIHAGLYLAPQPVPANVGHTYYTYEPLYPHEHLYAHRRTYLSFDHCNDYYDGSGGGGGGCEGGNCGGGGNARGGGGGVSLNKTTVVWQNGTQSYGYFPGSFAKLQQKQYSWQIKRWGKYNTGGGGHGGCAGGNCGGE